MSKSHMKKPSTNVDGFLTRIETYYEMVACFCAASGLFLLTCRREKYIKGDYILGKLNKDGQRISIRIEIPRKDGTGTVSFVSGWMAGPNGELRLITPYGGK